MYNKFVITKSKNIYQSLQYKDDVAVFNKALTGIYNRLLKVLTRTANGQQNKLLQYSYPENWVFTTGNMQQQSRTLLDFQSEIV